MIPLRTGSSVVDMIVGVHLGLDRVADAEVPPPRPPPPPSPLVRRAGLRWKRFVSDSLGQVAAKMHSTLFSRAQSDRYALSYILRLSVAFKDSSKTMRGSKGCSVAAI